MSCSKTNRGEFSEHMYVVRKREKCQNGSLVDCILSNCLVRFSSLGSERTISTDNNTNLKHLQAGSREKERSGLMSFLLMPQVNEQSRVLLRLRELKCCCSSQFLFKFLCIIYTSVKEATFYLFNLNCYSQPRCNFDNVIKL